MVPTDPPDSQPAPTPTKQAESNALVRQRSFLRQRHAVLSERAPEEATPAADEVTAIVTPGDLSFGVEAGVEDEASMPVTPVAGFAPTLEPEFQQQTVRDFRRRQQSQAAVATPADAGVEVDPGMVFEAPLPGNANNWVPLGPSVLRQGQAVGWPAVSGRVAGLAVAPGGLRVYVASANGGVWRSDDGGLNWRSTMDAWDLNPSTLRSDSLACGAIAIDQNDPDRVYVGTGEGGADSYYGVGPIRSDDGGKNWITEKTSTADSSLAGSGFYALAVDPADRERVVGATELGLYRRESAGGDRHHWVRKREGVFSAVVAARSGDRTVFYAAELGGNVLKSADGDDWERAGSHFPVSDVHRIALAVQPKNPLVVYALICRRENFHLRGVWRLDIADPRWREVAGGPPDLFGNDPEEDGQGWYDIAVAVDPNNAGRIYLGGSLKSDAAEIYPSSLYSCIVSTAGSGASLSYRMISRYVGANVHADIHALEFTPGSSNDLWVGCDGGLFRTRDATGAATFVARNTGLATLTMNFMSQHPTEEAVIFCGTQDNGTSRYTGEEVWLHSCWGDGGHNVVNWADPSRVLRTYIHGIMQRTSDGGQSYESWDDASLPDDHQLRSEFYAPLAGAPPNPAARAEADTVAFGGVRLWLSTDFGATWVSLPNDDPDRPDRFSDDALRQFPDQEFLHCFLSLVFASADRIYGGTNKGEVYRYDRQGGEWTRTAIHAAPLLRGGPVTRVAVDPADPSGDSVYVTLGGHRNYRHVWHFDGERWRHRSGPADDPDGRLLDVQHNAIVVDPLNPARLYVGADIGVWRSDDAGRHWEPFSFGLPDSAVLDLKIHERHRLLRAATHGRGVYEYRLDADTALPVELYVRDTQLDVGRRAAIGGLPDPTLSGGRAEIGRSPDVKVDAPARDGSYKTPTNQIDYFQFVDSIKDDSRRVATAAASEPAVNNRVYVLVHNRGLTAADGVQIMMLLAEVGAAGSAPDLPPDFAELVRQGHQINTEGWRSLGVQTVDGLRVGSPVVAAFDLPSSVLPDSGELDDHADHCLLVVLHSADDPYDNDRHVVNALVPGERKVTLHTLRVVP